MPLTPFDGELDAPDGVQPFSGRLDGEKPSAIAKVGSRIADLGLSAAKGVIAVPEAAVGIADIATGGRAGKLAEEAGFRPKEAKAMLDEYYSPEQKAANQTVQDAQGFLPTIGAALKNPSTIVQSVVESVPSMLAGGVAARGIAGATKIAPWLAGAAGEGIVGAGSAAEQTRQQTDDGLLTGKQTIANLASGLATAGLGAVGAKASQALKISDIDTVLAGGAAQGASKGLLRRVGEGAVSEGVLEELPQSMAEQALQNVAQDKPLGQGVPEAGAMGMLAGAVMGGGAAGALRAKPASTDVPQADAVDGSVSPPAGPLSAAATSVQGSSTALSGTRKIIADAAARQGVDPQLALMISSMETGGKFNADAANPKSSARGLFQFMEATRKEFPEVTPEQWKDPQVQAQYGVAFIQKTNATMERLLGAPPTPAQAYMGHLLGAYGAASVLKADPNLPVEQVIAGYDPKRAADIVRLNGMSGLTAGQAAEKWAAKAEQATGQLGQEIKAIPFTDAKVAQKRADAQSASTGTPFEVVDHPNAPGRFAVLPVAAKEDKSTPAKTTDIPRADEAPLTAALPAAVDTANINPETGEIKPAIAVREADRPKAQDGDILNLDGQPFPSMFVAKKAAKEAGDGFAVIKLGTSEFVVRPQGEVNVSQSPDLPAASATPSGSGLPEPGIGVEAGLGTGAVAGPAVEPGGVRDQLARADVSPADRADAGAVAAQQETLDLRPSSAINTVANDTPQPQPPATAQTPATQTPATAGTAAGEPAATGTTAGAGDVEAAGVVGEKIDKDWNAFSPESGTLNVPRADMPQIKAEHRGAMVNFLKARGIESQQEEVAPAALKPTQTEFSPKKVEQAKSFPGGDRSILVSSDGHILDGHHQWMAKMEAGEPVKVIRLNAPIADLLNSVKEFPSASSEAATQPAAASKQPEKINIASPATETPAQVATETIAPARPGLQKMRQAKAAREVATNPAVTTPAFNPLDTPSDQQTADADAAVDALTDEEAKAVVARMGKKLMPRMDAKDIIRREHPDDIAHAIAGDSWNGKGWTQPAAARSPEADHRAAMADVAQRRAEQARAAKTDGSLPPALSAQLQEAHKALGRDVKLGQVKLLRARIAREVETGKTNNGGVVATLKPKALNERRAQLARLDADLSLWSDDSPTSTESTPSTEGVSNSEDTKRRLIEARKRVSILNSLRTCMGA